MLIRLFIFIIAGIPLCCAQALTAAAPLYSLADTPQQISGVALAPALRQNAFEISGQGHSIRNVSISGGWHGFYFNGARDVTIDGCTILNPIASNGGGYGLWFTLNRGLNERISVRNTIVVIDSDNDYAQFPFRGYGLRDFVIENTIFIHRGKAAKSAFKLAEAKRGTIRNCIFVGWPVGLGANRTDSEEGYGVEGITFDTCVFVANDFQPDNRSASPLVIGSGCRDIVFKNCRIQQDARRVAVIRMEGPWRTRPASAASFETCTFTGGSRLDDGPNASGAVYAKCKLNGVAIGGEN